MRKKSSGVIFALLAAFFLPAAEVINVSQFAANDGKTDVSTIIQQLIIRNPNRTIYFPDGIYLISRPICTPADPAKSVHLKLDRFAIIQAAPEWRHKEAMIRLGGINPANDIFRCGSLYGLEGGIINGGGLASGIAIESGRETVIRDCSLKNVRIGIHVKFGANNGSSDADVANVNVVGNNAPDSIGVLAEGFDNTFEKMRIAAVNTGVRLIGGGNCLRDIHPLQIMRPGQTAKEYQTTCGFDVRSQDNVLDFCYSDNFAAGFVFSGCGGSTLTNCFCFWYAPYGRKHTAVRAEEFNSVLVNFRAVFVSGVKNVLLETKSGGCGIIQNPVIRGPVQINDSTKVYFK